ncbi:Ku protein, partial [Streptomyces rimosus]
GPGREEGKAGRHREQRGGAVPEKADERATEAGIPGRSSMTRDALLDALSGSGGQRHAKAS